MYCDKVAQSAVSQEKNKNKVSLIYQTKRSAKCVGGTMKKRKRCSSASGHAAGSGEEDVASSIGVHFGQERLDKKRNPARETSAVVEGTLC